MKRREFLQLTGAAAAALATGVAPAAALENKTPSASRLPRWRGFNLTEKFVAQRGGNPPFRESDLQWMADWGFDFARLPMSYQCWTNPAEPLKIREADLKDLDAVVELGRKHKIHINFNLHRAPGYCVNPPKEPFDLWTDEKALEACAYHWAALAKRFKGIPSDRVSFDLLNEPPNIKEETYVRVVRRLVQAIRAEDPGRLIIADGLQWGRQPVHGLADLGIGQSTRGYDPMELSHYQASWVNGERWPKPSWPLQKSEKELVSKDTLRRQLIEPWKKLEQKGVGVHVGEWGSFNRTPHAVALAWMRDLLDLWKEAGWGWALWNFRGGFGILDSSRQDVAYEDFHGSKLDREMLKLLQAG